MHDLVAIFVVLAATSGSARCDQDEWQYVVPPEGALHRSPQESPLLLSPDVPEGLTVDVTPRGKDLLFAQIRYGDPGSVRVAVAVDQPAEGEPILYVDANRDRVLAQSERLEGKGGSWETTLTVSDPGAAGGKPVERRVAFRLGRTRMVLGYATLGYVEGRIDLGGRTCPVRRMDADGNGFLTDPRDRIWIDLDADGKWSAFGEQFSFAPVVRVGDARYALRSDPLGLSLTCQPIEGFGHVRLRLPAHDGSARKDVLAVQVSLAGKDGTAVGILGHDVPIEVPVGEYRVVVVTLTLADPKHSGPWSFVFSENGRAREPSWHTVACDSEVVIDPIGTVTFGCGMDPAADPPEAGGWVRVRPRLLTGEGLLINSCYRGQGGWAESPRATSSLRDPSGTILATTDSGFT